PVSTTRASTSACSARRNRIERWASPRLEAGDRGDVRIVRNVSRRDEAQAVPLNLDARLLEAFGGVFRADVFVLGAQRLGHLLDEARQRHAQPDLHDLDRRERVAELI